MAKPISISNSSIQKLEVPINFEKFLLPQRQICCGPSMAGKTTYLKNVIKFRSEIFDKSFSRIIYSCPESLAEKSVSDELKGLFPEIEIVHGILSVDSLGLRTDKSHKLILIDDQFDLVCNSKTIVDIFCLYSHHYNISIIVTGHNIFLKSKYSTTLSRNATSKVIFFDKADQLCLSTLGRRIFPNHTKLLSEAFTFLHEHFAENYSKYLIIDTSPLSFLPQKMMVRSNIFPDEKGKVKPIFFIPN